MPVKVKGKLEYEIAEIVNIKIDKQRLFYLVKWLEYEGTDKETSWLPADELGHAPDLVKNFHLINQDLASPYFFYVSFLFFLFSSQ